MSEALDHGQRISGAEDDRRVVALQEAQPALPTPAQDRDVRRRELDLRIDHCPGESFPAERRDALRAVARAYAEVLSPQELRAFLGLEKGEIASLPEVGSR